MITDTSGVGNGLGGYNSTGGRGRRFGGSDSDDDTPAKSPIRRRRKRGAGGKSKASVQKPPTGLPKGWMAAWDAQYERYYFYNGKGVVTWDKPKV